ncbi:MAG: hypothetical protein LBT52_02390 [Clostridiales Family XIII bacterium]|nr:hypothetical protein [Clostridiales Family XIII bacterium]
MLYSTKGEVPEEEYLIPLGKANIMREGKDVTIISYSLTALKALKAAEMLESDGIDAEVLDLRTLSHLDKDAIIASAKKTGKVLIAHEGIQKFGVGAEVASVIGDSDAFFYLDRPVRRFGGDDMPIPYAPQLEAQVVPQSDTICAKVKELLE